METRTDNEKALIDKFLYGHVRPAWRKNEAQYHNSWDRLMPVVEKIAAMKAEVKFSTTPNRCLISYFEDETDDHQTGRIYTHKDHKNVEGESLIAVTYSAVVRFIKWHNSSNQPQKAS